MTEPARDIEAQMKAAVAEGNYARAGEIGTAAGFSLEFIDVVIANIEIELGRSENAKKIWPGLQLTAEPKVDVKPEAAPSESFAEMRKRREAEIAARQKREAENDALFKDWIANAKRADDEAREAQAQAEREHNRAADPGALPDAATMVPAKPEYARAVAPDWLKQMNDRHAHIGNYGNKSVVIEWVPSIVFPGQWR